MNNHHETLTNIVHTIVDDLFEKQDFITLTQHALYTVPLKPAMASLQPMLDQERDLRWSIEKNKRTRLLDKDILQYHELLTTLNTELQSNPSRLRRQGILEQKASIEQSLRDVTALKDQLNSQTAYHQYYYNSKNEQDLRLLSYTLFLDAIEEKIANTHATTQTDNLTGMVNNLRLFLAAEQAYDLLTPDLKALEGSHYRETLGLDRQKRQLQENQNAIASLETLSIKAANHNKQITEQLQASLAHKSHYQNQAIVTAALAIALLVIRITVSLSSQALLVSGVAIPLLFIISLWLVLMIKLAIDSQIKDTQLKYQQMTESAASYDTDIAKITTENDTLKTMIPVAEQKIADQLPHIETLRSKKNTLLEEASNYKDKARFFSKLLTKSNTTMSSSSNEQKEFQL